MNSNRNQPTALDPESVLVGNKLKEHLREIFNCAFEDTGRKAWMMNKKFSFCIKSIKTGGKNFTSTGTAGFQDSQQIWRQGIQEALLLREGPKGSGWNGDFQRALQHRTSVWQHHSDQEGAPRCGSTPKTLAGLTDLGKQSYLLRTRGKFPLVLSLPEKANSASWELTCSVTSEHTEMWDNPASLIPTVTKPAKTHTRHVSCQMRWGDA